MRKELGHKESDIICIYTGRFSEGKNPLCLAKAIDELVNRGEPYKAIFFGDGNQENEIKKNKGCIVFPFVKFDDLPQFYRIADIGVWPRQESTSVLDATACGLPVIISDKVQATERKEGNGITYNENSVEDMVRALLSLKDKDYRKKLGDLGIYKIKTRMSWEVNAKHRLEDYKKALN